jgi:hypothetical protein
LPSCRTAAHLRPVALLAAVPGNGKARRAGSVIRLPLVERHDSASAAVLLPLIALLLARRPVLLG